MNTFTQSDINFVVAELIADFSKSRAKAGTALHFPSFNFNRVSNWSPPQKAALDAAYKVLCDKGHCEMSGQNLVLTQNGVEAIYPAPGDFVERRILQWFRDDQARPGTVLFIPALLSEVTSKWNPRQEADFEAGIGRLSANGLVVPTADSVALTDSGYKLIYQQ